MKPELPRRRLIPKWRPVVNTLEAPEAHSLGRSEIRYAVGDPEELGLAIRLWQESRAPGLLGEILSFSVHPDLRECVTVVGYEALKSKMPMTAVQMALIRDLSKANGTAEALSVVSEPIDTDHPFQKPMRRLRALLRQSPDNALALLDYAQLQAAVGKLKSAERALKSALHIAPNNRTVIRTVARFYVHAQHPERGHQLLRRHERTPGDPWLMASEIALADAADVNPLFLLKGKRFLLDQKDLSPAHFTELAGAVAMAELAAGNLKRAREAQRRALLSPNDNVAAQAVDLERAFGISLDTPQVVKAIASSSEAQLLQAWIAISPDDVERHASDWHDEEPFSSRPIQMLATLYSQQRKFDLANRWINAGLLTDPNDRGLLVNRAYVYASANRTDEAAQTIRRVRASRIKDLEPYLKATEGLMAYQRADYIAGDKLYEESAAIFDQAHKPAVVAYCRLNQAIAAIEHQHPSRADILVKTNVALAAHPSKDSSMLLKIYATPEINDVPVENNQQRRMSQWVFDPSTNTLTEKVGITAVGAKAILMTDDQGR